MPASRTVFSAVLGVILALATTLDAAAQGWTIHGDRGVVTRLESGAIAAPNPLRHVPDELLVRLRPGLAPAAAAHALAAVATRASRRFHAVEHLYHLKLAPGVSMRQAIRALRRDPAVVYAEPNFVIESFATPNDPSFASQWALSNTGQTGGVPGADIGAPGAWDLTTGSDEIVVAVLDTGVDYLHQDLAASMFVNLLDCNANGVDDDGNGFVDDCHGIDVVNHDSDPMDDDNHGTHVAGTIGAAGNNVLGITGVAWNVTILPCKFLDATGTGDTAGAIACLDYVARMKDRGVNIVATSNSWGGGLFSQALREAIVSHQQRGILFVTAAGNSGADNDALRTYPCSYDVSNVICVAASDDRDGLAGFSNYGGSSVHLAAPGVGILSTIVGGAYTTADGTSMATPHVTGVVALLYAQDPSRDWRAVKNLLLAGGTWRASLANSTITRARLSALGALTCNGATVVSRLQPAVSPVRTGLGPLTLSSLHIACGEPAGPLTVTVSPSAQTVTLLDAGAAPDQVAADGVYTGTWTPPAGGTFSLAFPDGSVVTVEVDPALKPGFPVQAWTGSGSYHGGPAIHALVGNIDADPAQEILVTGLATGPLYAWKADGTPAPGWPAVDASGAAYPGLGQLAPGTSELEVFSAHWGSTLVARAGSGMPLPGWPRTSANFVATPPALADVDGDGVDEIFTEEEDWKLHAYRADGTVLPGWPATLFVGGQERHTPAVADLDGDGQPEIVTATGSVSPGGVSLLAYRRDGTLVGGFPVSFNGHVDTFPVIGDVDGDGQPDIVVAGRVGTGDGVYVFAANGALKRTMPASGTVFFGTALALADLDGDGVPEIIMQTNTALNVWKGGGGVLAGWPVQLGTDTWLKNAGPVVGDVDGDGQPDLVALALNNSGQQGEIRVYRRNGTLLPGFPKVLAGLGAGAVPAIADVDLDGRNDIVVASDFWNGTSGYYDKVWVYDLGGPTPHGAIHWGQFMGGPRHDGRYRPVAASGFQLAVSRQGAGSGVVTSTPAGIDCGADCSEAFAADTVVTLVATPDAGSTFTGWGGACAGQSSSCTVTMTGGRIVTATFAVPVALTVARAGAGSGAVTSAPAGIDCGGDCSEVYVSGATVALTATPAPGSYLAGWSGACTGTVNPCSVILNGDRSVTATFAPAATLTVALAGSGPGTVTSTPAGISCGSDCSEGYAIGAFVSLTATPSGGAVFSGWSGACTGTASSCGVVMSGDRAVTATFTQMFALSVGKTGPGTGTVTSTPTGIACGSDCFESYPSGTTVTLTATPNAGSGLAGWFGACAGQANPCTVTLTAHSGTTAEFVTSFPLTVTVVSTHPGGGAVSSAPAGITCGSDCLEAYPVNASVTLTATPSPNFMFEGWSGACSGAGSTCVVTMSASRNVGASFRRTFTVTATVTGSGTIESSPVGIACGADCSEMWPSGTSVTLTATPAQWWSFASWGGSCTGQGNPCTLQIGADTVVSATFTRPSYAVTVSKTGAGAGTVTSAPAGITCGTDCAESYPNGTTLILTAAANSGSIFNGWTGACAGQGNPCTLVVNAAQAVTASFAQAVTLNLTIQQGSGTGTVASNPAGIACPGDCSQVYARGTVVVLTATPNAGSSLQNWGGACSGSATTCTVTMTVNRSVTAKFKRP